MFLHYSAARNAFYDKRVHDRLPDDAVTISADEHARLLAAQAAGKIIRPGDGGAPTARRPPENGEQLRTRLITATKREAARRIERIAPIWRQLNDGRDVRGACGARLAAIERRVADIDTVRAASDRLEIMLSHMTARQLAKVDIADDTHSIAGAAE